jgi:multidrug efflux pump subunit AcrB
MSRNVHQGPSLTRRTGRQEKQSKPSPGEYPWNADRALEALTALQHARGMRGDRERIADLGLDLATVGRELGTLLGGDYVNRFNYFDRSYKVIPQVGEENRATLAPLRDLRNRTPDGQLLPVSRRKRLRAS